MAQAKLTRLGEASVRGVGVRRQPEVSEAGPGLREPQGKLEHEEQNQQSCSPNYCAENT